MMRQRGYSSATELLPLLALFAMMVDVSSAFSSVMSFAKIGSAAFRPLAPNHPRSAAMGMAVVAASEGTTFHTIFDFTNDEDAKKSIDSFERIDDAIMGGISTSTLQPVRNASYAKWSGVCRTDGGGFCGMRTLPFQEPLLVGDADGFYIDCCLASDNEPERRVWKIVTRTDTKRGEEVYQASFKLPKHLEFAPNEEDCWVRVMVPFSDFQQVRGPRLVEGGVPINVTSGLYQIGLSLSKFVMARNMTELENFRPGYFELRLCAIGLYADKKTQTLDAVDAPTTLTAEEAKQKRPMLIKLLVPFAKIFFSEQSNRRRSAMKILREQRGLSRAKAMLFGIRKRAHSSGILTSLVQTAAIVLVDSFRTVARWIIRLCLFYPILFTSRAVKFIRKIPSKLRRKAGGTEVD